MTLRWSLTPLLGCFESTASRISHGLCNLDASIVEAVVPRRRQSPLRSMMSGLKLSNFMMNVPSLSTHYNRRSTFEKLGAKTGAAKRLKQKIKEQHIPKEFTFQIVSRYRNTHLCTFITIPCYRFILASRYRCNVSARHRVEVWILHRAKVFCSASQISL